MCVKGVKKMRVVDSRYHPTKAEMEEDVSMDGSPEDVAGALFSGGPPVVESGKGEESRRAWERWLEGRGQGD